MSQETDALGRPVASEPIKESLAEMFKIVPPGKKGALILVADKGSDEVRAHIAANLDEKGNWKVAAGAGWKWGEKKPDTAYVALAGTW
jgi:hypothetical protein